MCLFSSVAAAQNGVALNACDLNTDKVVNDADVQMAINMSLGATACTANVQAKGVCDIVTVQRVINATPAVGGTCAAGSSHSVRVNWTASTSTNVTGYNIYRSITSGGPYVLLNATKVAGTSYTDSTSLAGVTYYYVVTAVDNTGLESLNSNQATAAVPYP